MTLSKPTPLDDEMAAEQYQFPPNLMPGSEDTFVAIEHDEHHAIYVEGEQASTLLKSDTTVDIEP